MVKDQDYLKEKASFCIDLAKKLGATDVKAAVGHSISETVNFRNRKLDESNRSDSLGVGLTIYIGKKKSSISSSNLTEDNIKTLIERCIETTKITPEDEFNSLPDKDLLATKIKDLNLYDDDHIKNEKKIEYLKEVEEVALEKKEIINTESDFSESKSNLLTKKEIFPTTTLVIDTLMSINVGARKIVENIDVSSLEENVYILYYH